MEITAILKEKKIPFQITSHHPVYTSQRMAAVEHVPGKNVAKPVVIQADGRFYMCVLPACCKVDLELLRQQLGAGEVELVPEQELAGLFPECELGAEPPVGSIFGLTTLMDQSLSRDEYLVFQAGRHDQSVRVKRSDYELLAHPRILSFTYHLH